MKPAVLRYGFYSILTMLVLLAIHLFIFMPPTVSWQTAEVAGYLTMTLSMIFVFFGIRHYRDKYNQGALSFGEGLKIGLLIVLGPSLCFALVDLLYVKVINPGWGDNYYADQVAQIRRTASATELPEKLKKLNEEKEFFSRPAMLFIVMFGTVFVIGFIVTIISALTLRRSRHRAPKNFA